MASAKKTDAPKNPNKAPKPPSVIKAKVEQMRKALEVPCHQPDACEAALSPSPAKGEP